MHKTTIPYLYGDNILHYLDLFARYLLEDAIGLYGCVNVLVVGGSALALKYGCRGTVDIDADISFAGNISKSIRRVAKSCRIPSDWLNQDFIKSPSFSNHLEDDALLMCQLQGYLNVYTVSDLTQLCMKLVSWRPKDLDDVRYLITVCFKQGYRYFHVEQKFMYLYGSLTKAKKGSLLNCKVLFDELDCGRNIL